MNYAHSAIKGAVFIGLLFISNSLLAQNTVSIGTQDLRSDAVLYLVANGDQGLILPAVADVSSFSSPSTEGMLLFNRADSQIYYWNGINWISTAGGGGAAQVLDYNETTGELSLTNGNAITINLSGGDIEGTLNNLQIVDGTIELSDLSDFGAEADQYLVYNGSAWEVRDVPSGTFSGVTTDDTISGDGLNTELSVVSSALDGAQIPNLPDNSDTNEIQNADQVPVTPAGNLTSTNVQSALEELQTDLDASGGTDDQQLSFDGINLSITDGNSVDISAIDTDTQLSETEVDAFVANNGFLTATDISGFDTNASDDVTTINQLTDVNAASPTDGEILKFQGGQWVLASDETATGGSGDIDEVVAGIGLTGGATAGTATLNVDVGTGADQIVQLDGSGRLPMVDGSQLTNLPTGGTTEVADGTTILGDGSVGDEFRVGSITTGQISDITSVGSGVIIETSERNLINTNESNIVGNTTAIAAKQDALPVGIDGQVLRLQAGNPIWDDETSAIAPDEVTITASGGTGSQLEVIDGSVTTDKLAADAVTTSEIADNTIANEDISPTANIDVAKLAPNGTNRSFLANSTSGDVQWVTASGDNQVLGTNGVGDLTFRDATTSVSNSGDGIRSILSGASDAVIATELAVREAIDAAGGSLQAAYTGGQTIELDGTNAISVSNNGSSEELLSLDNNGTLRLGDARTSLGGVRQQISVSNTSNLPIVHIENQGTGDAALRFWQGGVPNTYAVGVDGTDNNFKISNANQLGTNDRLVIDANGFVGIGAPAPTNPLHVLTASEAVALRVETTSTSSANEAIRSRASGSTNQNYGITGVGSGGSLAVGVNGIAGSATGSSTGVYGSGENSSNTGWIIGVQGNNQGTTTANNSYGVYGSATNTGSQTNYGVYGEASGADVNNYAGYFAGNTVIEGDLELFDQGSAPAVTTNKLYNVGGNLFWEGLDLTAAGGATLQSAYDASGGNIIQLDGTNEFTINTSSASPLLVTDDANGRVGIGTATPFLNLDIRGNALDDGALLNMANSDNSEFLRFFSGRQSDPNPFIQVKDGSPLRFANDASGFTELMRLSANGDLGIGIIATSKLHVFDPNTNGITIATGDGNNPFLDFNEDGILSANIFWDGGSDQLFVNTVGSQTIINPNGASVGIGTNNPEQLLDIRSQGADDAALMRVATLGNEHGVELYTGTDSDPASYINWREGDSFRFTTVQPDGSNFLEHMRIRDDGILQISTGLILEDGNNDDILIQAPATLTAQYVLTLPDDNGTGALTNDGTGNLSWTSTGTSAASVDGLNNVTVGSAGGAITSGDNNVFISGGFATTEGFGNVFVGNFSGAQNTTAGDNTFIGTASGQTQTSGTRNTYLGASSGATVSSGNDLTLLGHNANTNGTDGLINATALGANAVVEQSNSLVLGAISGINGATNNTNIGIGTSTPTDKLEIVDGGISITPADNPAGPNWMLFKNSDDRNASWGFNDGNDTNRDFRLLRYDAAGDFVDRPMEIQNATGDAIFYNRVGIGTNTPDYTLDVAGGRGVRVSPQTGGENFLTMVNADTDVPSWAINDFTNRDLAFYRYDNTGAFIDEAMVLQNSTGNVGIGTITPSYDLEVVGDINATGAIRINGLPVGTSTSTYWNENAGDLSYSLGNIGVTTLGQSFGLNPTSDSFMYEGDNVGNYSLGWYTDPFGPSGAAYISGFDGVRFFTASAVRMSISSGGNVGIGTSTPSTALDIVGDIQIENANAATGRVLTATDASGNATWQDISGDGNGIYDGGGIIAATTNINLDNNTLNFNSSANGIVNFNLQGDNSDFFVKGDLATEYWLAVDGINGRVGINTPNPQSQLHVAGTSQFDGTINTNNQWISGDGGAEGLFVADNGNVAVGRNSSLAQFSVDGRTYIFGDGDHGTGFTFTPTIDLAIDDSDTGLEVVADGTMALYTNNLERARFTSAGLFGVGNTGPVSALTLGNVAGSGIGLHLTGFGADITYATGEALAFGEYDGSTFEQHMRLNSAGNLGLGTSSISVRLEVDGSIEYTGTITDVSDRRLKENLSPLSNVTSKLDLLRGYSYNMIDDSLKTREYGVIAQDVQKAFPLAVKVIDPEKGHLGVSYIQLIPILIEATKEQQVMIDSLQHLNAENQSRIAALEARVKQREAPQEVEEMKTQLATMQTQIDKLTAILMAEADKGDE